MTVGVRCWMSWQQSVDNRDYSTATFEIVSVSNVNTRYSGKTTTRSSNSIECFNPYLPSGSVHLFPVLGCLFFFFFFFFFFFILIYF